MRSRCGIDGIIWRLMPVRDALMEPARVSSTHYDTSYYPWIEQSRHLDLVYSQFSQPWEHLRLPPHDGAAKKASPLQNKLDSVAAWSAAFAERNYYYNCPTGQIAGLGVACQLLRQPLCASRKLGIEVAHVCYDQRYSVFGSQALRKQSIEACTLFVH